MTDPKRLLVVGGSGFIGRHVIKRGLARGWLVTSVSLSGRVAEDGVLSYAVDVADNLTLSQILADQSFDYIVYCAGYIKHSNGIDEMIKAVQSRLTGITNVINAVDRAAVRCFVNIGSSEVYGLNPSPQIETKEGDPQTPYAFVNSEVARLLQAFYTYTGFPAVNLRCFLIYGPGQQPPRLVASLIEEACAGRHLSISSGDIVKDLLYVDDLVDAIFLVLESPETRGQSINVCSAIPVSVRQVAGIIAKHLKIGKTRSGVYPVRPSENLRLFGDNSRAKELLKWRPRITLEEGIRRVIESSRADCARVSDDSPTVLKPHSQEETRIRVSSSFITGRETRRVTKVLLGQYLGMGNEVRQFENQLTDFFGRPAVCVVNGTAALQLAVQACGIGIGDEVLVPSLTYVASFQAISAAGARPVACEILPDSLLIDLDDAARRLSSRTRAIMPVHYAGGVGQLERIFDFASRHRLRVIADSAHAFGTTYKGKRVGAFGDIDCFSFDGIKNITAGEGGCIVTDDPHVLATVRDARLLGVENDTAKRYKGDRSWTFNVSAQGWRYHMSNIMAAVGMEQLKQYPQFAARRQHLAKLYDNRLARNPDIVLLPRDYDTVVPHIYVIRVRDGRHRLQQRLQDRGIQTGIHYQPNHLLDFFRQSNLPPLSVTEEIFSQLLTLPLHLHLTDADVESVCSVINSGRALPVK